MRKSIFSLIFVLAVGVAFFVTRHFITGLSHPQKQVWSNPSACNLSCCLPEDIKLSPAQREKLQDLEQTYCQCRDGLTMQIDQKRLTMANLLLQSDPDLSAVHRLLEDIAQLQVSLERKTIQHILALKKQLDPQQQDQFISSVVNEVKRRCQHQKVSSQ